MNPTIYDIAKSAHVSKSTVSRVLNNSPNISEKSKQRVLKAIEYLNYQPSKIARALTTGLDAILVVSRSSDTTKNNPFFSEILQVISSISEKKNYDVILHTAQNNIEVLKKTTSKIAKGILMLSSPVDEEVFKQVDQFNIPCVVVGKVEGNYKNIYSVDTNNYKDSYNMVQYMVDLGHMDIACLYSPQDYNVSIDRLEGYIQCMKDNNLPVCEELTVNCGFTMEGAYAAAQKLFKGKSYPTAIFATDDLKLLSLYKIMDEYNISAPSDILVGGYSNMEITPFLFPSFIQIENPTATLGEVATKMLFQIINGEPVTNRSTIIPTTRKIQGSKYSL